MRTYLLQFRNGTREMTGKEIVNFGYRAVLKRRWKLWLAVGIALVLWCFLLSYILEPGTELYVGVIGVPLVCIWAFIWTGRKMGQKILAYVKEKTEKGVSPVKINL